MRSCPRVADGEGHQLIPSFWLTDYPTVNHFAYLAIAIIRLI